MGNFKEFVENLFMSAEDKAANEVANEVIDVVVEEVNLEDESEVVDIVETSEVEVESVVEVEAEVIEEVIEDTPEYMLKADVEELVSGIVDKTLERINLAKEAHNTLKLSLENDNTNLKSRLEKLELELQKPGKAPEKVIPSVEVGKPNKTFNMQDAINKGLNK